MATTCNRRTINLQYDDDDDDDDDEQHTMSASSNEHNAKLSEDKQRPIKI